jgi:hypothetical protein
MKNLIIKNIQWLLIKMMVVKTNGRRFKDGSYQTYGLYILNPISWLIIVPVCIWSGCIGFFKSAWYEFVTITEDCKLNKT